MKKANLFHKIYVFLADTEKGKNGKFVFRSFDISV
jgi:hypothetical protein